jgi:uncharacterized protein
MWIIAALAISFGFDVSAQAASFDCNKATTRVEQAICGDQSLSTLDDQLGQIYRAYEQALPDAEAGVLLTIQRKWLDDRVAECDVKGSMDKQNVSVQSSNCLILMYFARIQYLSNIEIKSAYGVL